MTKASNTSSGDYAFESMNDDRAAEIEAWLNQERSDFPTALDAWEDGGSVGPQPTEGFRCNWDAVMRGWRDGQEVVVLVVDGRAAGFLDGTAILEVKPEFRGLGYGKILAEHMLELAFDQGRSLVEIGIAPSTAMGFWERMGFTLDLDRSGSGGGIFAFKILPRAFELGAGRRVPYKVSWFSEDAGYASTPVPFAEFEGDGELLADGSVQLASRAYCFEPADDQHVDYFVRIELDGIQRIFDKAKREECREMGVRRDAGYVYFVDRITE